MSYLIHHFLEKSSDLNPGKEAVIHGNNRYTYQEIEAKANQTANWLLQSGIKKGDRVAILLRNSVEYIYSYYGVLKTGAIAVPFNTGLEGLELGEMLKDCSAKVLISETYFSKLIINICKSISCLNLIAFSDKKINIDDNKIKCIQFSDIYPEFSSNRPHIPCIDQDISSIIYTSGSTGKPKGVMLSHLNIVSNTRSIVSYLHLTEKDKCMVILPFYYVYGKSLLNTHFKVSGTIIIDNRFTFPNAVLKNMIEEKATGFAGVPSTYSILVNRSSMAKMNFPSLRYITQAGGHMPVQVRQQLLEIFPDKQIFIMYGATEASARLAYLEPDQLGQKIKSFGRAIPNVEIRIVDENSEEVPPDYEGEITARGSNIMTGYWNAPGETSKVLKNGWYYTGDLGIRDKDGFLYITGRKKDMIKSGIYKISANEIEEVLYKYPGIHEAAVIGLPDDILGESINAAVVPKPGNTLEPDEIMKFCNERLPSYKVPKTIKISKNLPKNEAGKVLKKQIKEIFK
ncbi:AMP-dependent synthetase and ligase [Desulfonema limicola]|uniref:AMP-dependent synthetase and ligase n=1 Tax=Desulfonema limicola TaxID=45656 RepID=A0A975B5D8_9BACT|nr:class I adenylate-forming enzyme family protein [Desulfonema limicola]QTA79105.1 AMP-dependent synthetase and ligase [Desulfonema limicola]